MNPYSQKVIILALTPLRPDIGPLAPSLLSSFVESALAVGTGYKHILLLAIWLTIGVISRVFSSYLLYFGHKAHQSDPRQANLGLSGLRGPCGSGKDSRSCIGLVEGRDMGGLFSVLFPAVLTAK